MISRGRLLQHLQQQRRRRRQSLYRHRGRVFRSTGQAATHGVARTRRRHGETPSHALRTYNIIVTYTVWRCRAVVRAARGGGEEKKGDVLTSSRVTKRVDRGADPARSRRPGRFGHHCRDRDYGVSRVVGVREQKQQ